MQQNDEIGSGLKAFSEEWWLQQLKQGVKRRRDEGRFDDWPRLLDYYMHAYDPQDVPVNLIYAYGRSMMPSLIFQRPAVVHIPRFPQHIPYANLLDSIDSVLMQEMEVVDVVRRAVLSAFLTNVGAVEVGFDTPAETPSNFYQLLAVHMGLEKSSPIVDRARRDFFPWLDHINSHQLILDPSAVSLRACRWYAKVVYLPVRIAKKLPGINKRRVKGTHLSQDVLGAALHRELEDLASLEEYICFYEVHDAEQKQWFWMDKDGKFLSDPVKDILQIDGLPLEALIFNHNPHSIWGVPDGIYLEPMQIDINDSRRMGFYHRRLSVLKAIVERDLIDEEEVDKLFTEDPRAILTTRQLPPGKSVRDAIAFLDQGTRLDLLPYEAKLLEYMQYVLGMGPNQLGTFAPGRRTKYEAQIVEARNTLRLGERRQAVATLISNLFRKVDQLILKYWTTPMLVRVVGVEAARYWVEVKPSDIKMEMEVSVDVESLAPPSPEKTKEEMMAVLQILAKVPGANLVPLVRQFLSKFSWADKDVLLPQAPQQAPLSMEEFVRTQQTQLQNPELPRQIQGNLAAMQVALGGRG